MEIGVVIIVVPMLVYESWVGVKMGEWMVPLVSGRRWPVVVGSELGQLRLRPNCMMATDGGRHWDHST